MPVRDLYAAFLDALRTASQRILLLDYDGTLAPFRAERHLAVPYPEVPQLLKKIAAAGTRVVLISGRMARDVASLCGIQPRPEIWGSHGLERLLSDDSYEVVPLPEKQLLGLSLAARGLEDEGFQKAAERKPGGIALHWRGKPASQVEQFREKALKLWEPVAHEYGLRIVEFDGGVEIRSPVRDKGSVVQAILSEAKPGATVAYLGDDQTDEDAFRALKGKGLAILVRPESRATSADLWLQPPELIEFLKAWLQVCGEV